MKIIGEKSLSSNMSKFLSCLLYTSDNRNQRTEIRKQKTEDRRQKTDVRNQKTGIRNQKSDIEAVDVYKRQML